MIRLVSIREPSFYAAWQLWGWYTPRQKSNVETSPATSPTKILKARIYATYEPSNDAAWGYQYLSRLVEPAFILLDSHLNWNLAHKSLLPMGQ